MIRLQAKLIIFEAMYGKLTDEKLIKEAREMYDPPKEECEPDVIIEVKENEETKH